MPKLAMLVSSCEGKEGRSQKEIRRLHGTATDELPAHFSVSGRYSVRARRLDKSHSLAQGVANKHERDDQQDQGSKS